VSPIVTQSTADVPDTTEVLVAERACTVTLKLPPGVQLCDAAVVPCGSQPEFVPSPHENSYCTGFPRLEVAPLAV
jgi:hypothetical protein